MSTVPRAPRLDPAGRLSATDEQRFAPPRWLRNPHVQSVLSSSSLRRALQRNRAQNLLQDARELILDCGEGVRLQGFYSQQRVQQRTRGLVILLHGWEGSAGSNYILSSGTRLLEEGFDVFRLNFRDHGATHHLNRELFHSCRIDEVVGAVHALAKHFPQQRLAVAGFSLGGNFALRVAARAPEAGLHLVAALAVCPVIDPAQGLNGIERAPWFYQMYFLRKWRSSLLHKQQLFPDLVLFTKAELAGNLRQLTASLVERHTRFGSLDAYLSGYSVAGPTLSALSVPTDILTAADDPVIPLAAFHNLQLPAIAHLDIVDGGGHCGFIDDLSLHSWSEDYIAARLLARFAES